MRSSTVSHRIDTANAACSARRLGSWAKPIGGTCADYNSTTSTSATRRGGFKTSTGSSTEARSTINQDASSEGSHKCGRTFAERLTGYAANGHRSYDKPTSGHCSRPWETSGSCRSNTTLSGAAGAYSMTFSSGGGSDPEPPPS